MPRQTVDGIADDMLKASELDGEAFYAAMKALDARVRAKVSGRAANFLERGLGWGMYFGLTVSVSGGAAMSGFSLFIFSAVRKECASFRTRSCAGR
jgi:hypothetical protein